MSDYDHYDDECSPDCEACPRCNGDGTVTCHCGGDLCVCDYYGEAPCPTCHGEGEVMHERAERFLKAQREAHAAFSAAHREE